MPEFRYTVIVRTDTAEHAQQVINERTQFDEELTDEGGASFDYSIEQAGDTAPAVPDAAARTILAHLNITLAADDTRSVDELTEIVDAAVEVGFDSESTGGMTPTVALVEEV